LQKIGSNLEREGKFLKISELITGCEFDWTLGNLETEIKGISYNSKEVKEGYLFVAIKGFKSDGHNFIKEAIKSGAKAIAIENEDILKNIDKENLFIIKAKDNRKLLSKLASNFYNHPSLKLNVIGITGTNGKTTTSFLIYHILKELGKKCGLIGTINYIIGEEVIPSIATTPESLEFQNILNRMVKSSIEYVSAEISSHSLKLHRVDDIHFRVGIFTNLTEDHFDFHNDFNDYFESKSILFKLLKESKKEDKFGVINIDDEWGRKLYNKFSNDLKILTYGIDNEDADFKAEDINFSLKGISFNIRMKKGERFFIESNLLGKFNIYNIMAGFITLYFLGFDSEFIIDSIKSFRAPSGRMEIIERDGVNFIIDYAHTEDALRNVLESIKSVCSGRVITIFGCGGDRDRKKRPLMGRVASKLSDIVIVTSDNPRSEDPNKIIDEIEKGIEIGRENYYRIIDRKEAIRKGIEIAREGDFVLIAGKGHEDYQIIGNRKLKFSDKEVLIELLNNLKG
jgi:UDP-N-acetylmuramoyl-L-alanyl-D-glutamate--2,6-diaminopimelate ligase